MIWALLIICPFLLGLPGEWKPISLCECAPVRFRSLFCILECLSWPVRLTAGQRISTKCLMPWHFDPKRTRRRCAQWAIVAYSQASVCKSWPAKSSSWGTHGWSSPSMLPAVSVFHLGEIVGRITPESHKEVSWPVMNKLYISRDAHNTLSSEGVRKRSSDCYARFYNNIISVIVCYEGPCNLG